MPQDSCPTADELQKVLDGLLVGPAVETIAAHLETCLDCAELAGKLDSTSRWRPELGSAGLLREEPPEMALLVERLRGLWTEDGAGRDSADQIVAHFLRPSALPDELGWIAHYRVLGHLGAGGMGVVFAAEDTKLGRAVAIKFLQPRLASDEAARARFIKEARAMAAIRHASVITVFEVGGEADLPYLVMEQLDGETLEAKIRRGERLAPADVAKFGRQIAEGLAAAHQRGLLHRDVKPANVWVESAGEHVTLLDFGLARGLDEPADLTQRGAIIGTPAFMSPEQAAGLDLDARSDLFSLGSVLYQLATGRLPFEGASAMATLTALAQASPTPAHFVSPAVPPSLSDLLARLLARDPNERPASAAVVARELRSLELALAAPDQESSRGNPQPDALTKVAGDKVTERTTGTRRAAGIAIATALLALFCGVIVVRIRTKDGTEIEIPLPPGASAQIVERKDGPSTTSDNAPAVQVQPSPLDALQRADIPPYELAMAGQGDPLKAPAELVAVLGDSRLRHWGPVMSASFHPNKRWLATASADGVRVWDVATGEQRFAARGGGLTMYSLATISPDGRWLAWLKYNSQGTPSHRDIVLSDAETGQLRATLSGHQHTVHSLAFSSDGSRLASASSDGWVKLWTIEPFENMGQVAREWHLGQPAKEGDAPTHIHVVQFAPGKRLLAGSRNRERIDVLDSETGERVAEIPSRVHSLTINADGTRLAAFCGNDGIRIWEVGSWRSLRQLTKLESSVVAFHPTNPDWLVLAGRQNRPQSGFKVWSLSQDKPLHQIQTRGLDTIRCLTFTFDGRTMALGGSGGVQLWDAKTWEQIRLPPRGGHAGAINDIAISHDQRSIMTGGSDGNVLRWSMGSRPLQGETIYENLASVTMLRLDATSRSLAVGLSKRETVLLDPADSKPGHALRINGELLGRSQDGLTLLMRRESKPVLVTSQGVELRRLTAPEAVDANMKFSPDGRLTVMTSRFDSKAPRNSGPCRLWDSATGVFIGGFTGTGDRLPMAISPDGTVLAERSSGGVHLHLLELPSGQHLHSLQLGEHPLDATFSSDGRILAVGMPSGRIRLWEVRTGALHREIQGTGAHNLQDDSQRLAFSPDGRYLLTANANGTAYVLRLISPREEK